MGCFGAERMARTDMSNRHNRNGTALFVGPDGESRPVRRVPVFTIVALALLMTSVDSTIVAVEPR